MRDVTKTYRLIARLLVKLEQSGIIPTTRQQLWLQELLNRIPEDIPLDKLHTILSPLFATSKEEQEQFYALFNQCLEEIAQEDLVVTTPNNQESTAERESWWQLLAAIGLLFGLMVLGIWWMFSSLEKSKTLNRTWLVVPGETERLELPTERAEQLLFFSFCNGQQKLVDSTYGTFYLDTPAVVNLIPVDTLHSDTTLELCMQLVYSHVTDIYQLQVRMIDRDTIAERSADNQGADPQPPLYSPLDDYYVGALDMPAPHNVADYKINENETALADFWNSWGWPIKLLLLLLLGVILWLLRRYRARKKARLVAQIVSGDVPPYVWQVKFDEAIDIDMGPVASQTLNQLRRRQEGEVQALDIHQTIQRTINEGGQVSLAYQRLTRPPEYLILIDRRSREDHRAELFDQLYETFRANEVLVSRYFFDCNPKLCFNEWNPDGVAIQDLQHQYPNARLLLITGGYHLLHPLTNLLSKWTSVFERWQERALLSTTPVLQWGQREVILSGLFQTAPATIAGLQFVLDTFERSVPADIPTVVEQFRNESNTTVDVRGGLIEGLKAHFDEPMLYWIVVCAIYPSLHWNLTIRLGRLIEEQFPGTELLTIDRLQSLFRLPWFVQGKIPNPARNELLQWLEEQGKDRFWRQQVDLIIQEATPPETNSVAYDDYQMNVIVNQLLFEDDPSRKQDLEDSFKRYLEAGYEPDFVIFKYLDRPRQSIDYLVPDSWKPFVYPEGRPFMGWFDWTWIAAIWILVAALVLGYNPGFQSCDGEKVAYAGLTLCIDEPAKAVILQEQKIIDAIEGGNLVLADSFLNTGDWWDLQPTVPEQFDTLFANVGASFFRKGASIRNLFIDNAKSRIDPTATNEALSLLIDTIGMVGCPYFEKAYLMDSTIVEYQEYYNNCFNPIPQELIKDIQQTTTSENEDAQEQGNTRTINGKLIPRDPNTPSSFDEIIALNTPILPALKAIPGRTFQMGCHQPEVDCIGDDLPTHQKLINAFFLSTYEVTNAEFVRFLNDQGNQFEGGNNWYDMDDSSAPIRLNADSNFVVEVGFEDHPVTRVSFFGAQAYCNWLNTNSPGRNYRLPTEAEWEFAARGGAANEPFAGGMVLDDLGWYEQNSSNQTHARGGKLPNGLGYMTLVVMSMNGYKIVFIAIITMLLSPKTRG